MNKQLKDRLDALETGAGEFVQTWPLAYFYGEVVEPVNVRLRDFKDRTLASFFDEGETCAKP
jgi:hypothetical protein